MTFYNTVPLEKDELKDAQQKTRSQDEIIKEFIKTYYKKIPFTTRKLWEVYTDLTASKTPYSSIVRAVNTLKNSGFIVETGNKVKGVYGRKVLELKKA